MTARTPSGRIPSPERPPSPFRNTGASPKIDKSGADCVRYGDPTCAFRNHGDGGPGEIPENRRELDEYRNVDGGHDSPGNLAKQGSVRSNLSAIAFGVRAGHVQLKAIGDRFQNSRCFHKVRNRGAEDGNQKKLIRRDLNGLKFRPKRRCARIREAHGIDVASFRVLSENRLAVSGSR